MYVLMLYDLSIWLDVCRFEWELGSGDSVEGGLEQVSYLGYELSSEANADLYGIHDPCIIRRYVIKVPICVNKYIKISLCIYIHIYSECRSQWSRGLRRRFGC